jgi:hypothetical protein
MRKVIAVWFVLFLSGTLGVSILLQRLVSPIGDAVVAAASQHERHLTGLLTAQAPDRYTVYDGSSYHALAGRVPRRYVGHRVSLVAVLDSAGQLQVNRIRLLE